MSGRSFRRELALVVALVGCGKHAPEADPARVHDLAARMLGQVPTPAATRDCTPADLHGGAAMTFRTLMLLGGQPLANKPEHAEWINPRDLDAPAARVLVDSKDEKAKRQAAAQLLAAPFWIAYKVDLVDAPMALGVRELKRGTVGTRVIRYERSGAPTCVLVFMFQNDQAVSDAMIARSDARLDPAVTQALREDLAAQYVKQAPR